jgi:hypothetical protein
MDIVTEAESNLKDTYYVPFIFKELFPGLIRDFPKGARVNRV